MSAPDSLKPSEALFRSYFDLGQVGMCITSLDQKWLHVNSHLCEMLGYTPEELVKMTWAELTHPDDLELDLAQFRRLVAGESKRYSIDKRFIHKYGKVVYTHLTVACKRKPDDTIEYVIASLEDITDRKHAEAILSFHSAILNSVAQGIYLVRVSDGTIAFANPQFERMFGYEAGELLGKHVSIVNATSDTEPDVIVKTIMSELARSGQWRGETHNVRKDGTPFWCYATVSTFDHPEFGPVWVSAHEDITQRKNTEEALQLQKDYLKAIFDTEPECVKVVSSSGELLDMNPAGLKMLEVDSLEEAKQIGLFSFIDRSHLPAFIELHRSVMDGNPGVLEFPIKGKKGGIRWLETHATPLRDKDGKVISLLGLTRDITERRKADDELRKANAALTESEERWKFALEGSGAGVWDWNFQTGDAQFSKRWKEMLGFSETEIENNASEWKSRVHPDDLSLVFDAIQAHMDGRTPTAIVEFRMLCKDGSWKWILGRGIVVSRSSDGKPLRLVGTNTDITQRKQMEDQVRQLAFYDMLTNLANRRLLNDRLTQAMAASKRSENYGAVMFLDLDNFKPLNDTHGHQVGDLLLVEVAARLRACVREMDTLARFGGDEFVVMLCELDVDKTAATSQARLVAEKILSSLSAPYLLEVSHDGQPSSTVEHHCTASIGVAMFINHEGSQNDIIKWADTAMYQAKTSGRNQIRFYES